MNNNVIKTCGFYISEYHLAMMILPKIVEDIENGIEINIIFNKNIKKEINEILDRININEFTKRKIKNLNWDNKIIDNEKLLKNKYNNIFINGNIKEINKINSEIILINEENKLKNINIINCYDVEEYNKNIKEILDYHNYIFNTSGTYRVEELFKSRLKKAS